MLRSARGANVGKPAYLTATLTLPVSPAFLVLGGNVFGLLAPIVTGYIVQATGSFASAFVLAGVLALVGAVLSLVLTRHTLGEKVSLAAALAPSAG